MIKDRYYYMMLLVSIFSHFIFYNPSYMTKYICNGAIMAILFALIEDLIVSYLAIYVFNYFKNYTLVEINREMLGKKFGDFVSSISIIFNFLSSLFMFMGLIEIVRKFLLQTTPLWFVALLFVITIALSLLNTEETFLYLLGYLGIFIIFNMILYYILSFKELRMEYVKGTLMHSIKLPNFSLIGVAMYYYSGVRYLQLFNPQFQRISYKRTSLIHMFIAFPAALLTILIPAGIWGTKAVQAIEHPWITAADALSLDLFFIERVVFVLMPLFLTLAATNVLIYCFVGKGLLHRMDINNNVKKIIMCMILFLFIIFRGFIDNLEQLINLGILNMIAHSTFNIIGTICVFFLVKRRERRLK